MMIQMTEELKSKIKELGEELANNESIWNDEDESLYWLKKSLNQLDTADRIIMLLYVELASLREVGKVLGLSHTIIRKEITRIKQNMYDFLKDNSNSDNYMLLDRFNWNNNKNKKTNMEMVS